MDKKEIFLQLEKQIQSIMMGDSNNFYEAQKILLDKTDLSQSEVRSIISGWKGDLPAWVESYIREGGFIKNLKSNLEKYNALNALKIKKSEGIVRFDDRSGKFIGDVKPKHEKTIRVVGHGKANRQAIIKKQNERKGEERKQQLEKAQTRIYRPVIKYDTPVVEEKESVLDRETLEKNKLLTEQRALIERFWEEQENE